MAVVRIAVVVVEMVVVVVVVAVVVVVVVAVVVVAIISFSPPAPSPASPAPPPSQLLKTQTSDRQLLDVLVRHNLRSALATLCTCIPSCYITNSGTMWGR